MNQEAQWNRFLTHLCTMPTLNMSVDISRMNFPDDYFLAMEPLAQSALEQMQALEGGSIANPDEERMVGHYWLRAPRLAPDSSIEKAIVEMNEAVRRFAADVRTGAIATAEGRRFSRMLVVGIGGSALGPQLLADALSAPDDQITPFFIDNTDPDGIDRVFRQLGSFVAETLVLIISKSGGTKETRNGLVEVRELFRRQNLSFAQQAVAVTGEGSALDLQAKEEKWLARFPMWDWVGGRTSITSAVGLLPAALLGIDTAALLAGAAACDETTRNRTTSMNPALLLALMWHHATNGKGERDMVVLPYKDRLALFSRYLQQLIMESLGKEKDIAGRIVHQGLTVYGNKGSTDQHAYIQQLREGVNNFFATFIRVLTVRSGPSPEVEPGRNSGDYLHGFLLGTRQALAEMGRESITITLERLDPHTMGGLIALYERAVGLYASMIGINAYHQPGVEAGKVAAEVVLELQRSVIDYLREEKRGCSIEEIARQCGSAGDEETIFLLLEHLAANSGDYTVIMSGNSPTTRTYQLV
jgi:glucose-6-phosphate isomerase